MGKGCLSGMAHGERRRTSKHTAVHSNDNLPSPISPPQTPNTNDSLEQDSRHLLPVLHHQRMRVAQRFKHFDQELAGRRFVPGLVGSQLRGSPNQPIHQPSQCEYCECVGIQMTTIERKVGGRREVRCTRTLSTESFMALSISPTAYDCTAMSNSTYSQHPASQKTTLLSTHAHIHSSKRQRAKGAQVMVVPAGPCCWRRKRLRRPCIASTSPLWCLHHTQKHIPSCQPTLSPLQKKSHKSTGSREY